MDDNTAQNNQTLQSISSDPAIQLKDLLEGGAKAIADETNSGNIVISSKKVSNSFWRSYVAKMKEKGMSADEIIDVITKLDEVVEKGEVTQEDFDNLD